MKMANAYDHLFKLLIIGDSGKWARSFPRLYLYQLSSFHFHQTFPSVRLRLECDSDSHSVDEWFARILCVCVRQHFMCMHKRNSACRCRCGNLHESSKHHIPDRNEQRCARSEKQSEHCWSISGAHCLPAFDCVHFNRLQWELECSWSLVLSIHELNAWSVNENYRNKLSILWSARISFASIAHRPDRFSFDFDSHFRCRQIIVAHSFLG